MAEITFNDLIKKSFLKLDVFAKISVFDVFLVMLLTLIVGMFIFYVYKKTFRGVVYSYTFNASLVLMCLITALIIMTISSNVILSLGMVGALSIVRFRTALKDGYCIYVLGYRSRYCFRCRHLPDFHSRVTFGGRSFILFF